MLVIEIRFLTGRYNANPWGRNVNEGEPEWPPSPYRLIRALFDTWQRKYPNLEQSTVESAFRKLASGPPSYRLPESLSSHVRCFLIQNDNDPSHKQKIFDAFVTVDPKTAVEMIWPDVILDESETESLNWLLGGLNYLGRSESWVESRINNSVAITPNCWPKNEGNEEGDRKTAKVACIVPPEQYRPIDDVGKKRKSKMTWMEAITYGTKEMLRDKADSPPLLVSLDYSLPKDALNAAALPKKKPMGRVINGVIYAMQANMLPSVTDAVQIAEQVHVRLMGINKFVEDENRIFTHISGKEQDGKPAKGHRHLYILPIDKDSDGRLDHLMLLCREPLTNREIMIMDRLTKLWQPGGKGDVKLVPIQWGEIGTLDLTLPSTTFSSSSPFVTPRFYRKGRGEFSDWLMQELKRECLSLGLPEPIKIVPIPSLKVRAREIKWYQFTRSRRNEQERYGMGFRLEFSEPVQGPISLGYGAHFGLGLFLPSY